MGLGPGRNAFRTLACLLVMMAALRPLGAQDPEAAANQKKARATLDAMVTALGGAEVAHPDQRHAAGPDIGLLSRQAHRHDL